MDCNSSAICPERRPRIISPSELPKHHCAIQAGWTGTWTIEPTGKMARRCVSGTSIYETICLQKTGVRCERRDRRFQWWSSVGGPDGSQVGTVWAVAHRLLGTRQRGKARHRLADLQLNSPSSGSPER